MDSPDQRELLKGSLDLLVLSLLLREPMYGYQIVKEVRERSDNVIQLKEGSLYPALHRLERLHLIEGNWQPRADGVGRRYYQLTAQGREVAPLRAAAWQRFVTGVAGVLRYA